MVVIQDAFALTRSGVMTCLNDDPEKRLDCDQQASLLVATVLRRTIERPSTAHYAAVPKDHRLKQEG